MSNGLLQKPIASLIQVALYERLGEQFLVLCNPFKEYSDVRERITARQRMAQLCIAMKFKGTRELERAVCS